MSLSDKMTIFLFWILVVSFFVISLLASAFSAPVGLIGVAITVAFVLFHGSRLYGWKNIIIFFTITIVISWCLESLSILTGIPFGNYYYTGIGKIGEVPWIIMPAYFGTGYLSWLIGHTLLNNYKSEVQGKNIFLLPFIASFVMVMWDLSMDPILSTIQGEWVWVDPGFYFGVPLTNFVGWFITVYLIYQVFALYLSRYGTPSTINWTKIRSFWLVIPLMYLGVSMQFLLAPFFKTTFPMIYWSIFLIAIYTMVFVSIISLLRIVEKFGA
ncbi:MAG: carotenoid biosynthesis protein [Candidatus Thorarchaeota archaeon]